MNVTPAFVRSVTLAGLLVAGTTLAPAPATGAERLIEAPTARSRAVSGPRLAILLQPQPPGASSRATIAADDRDVLSKRLRDVGYEVWTIGPGQRPDFVRDLRDTVGRVPGAADVVVIALGPALGGRDDVFLIPSGSRSDLADRPDFLEAEGVRLGDALRRLAAGRPRELVAILDECRPTIGERCPLDAASGASGASVIDAERVAFRSGSAPLAARPSSRDALLSAMTEEGQMLPDSFTVIGRSLAGSDLAAFAASRLSASFAFVPAGFFAGLPTECNRVDPQADPASLRAVALDPLLRACERAVAEYPFARVFAERLGVAREQRAFQRAIASCDDRLAAASYRSTYPAGRFLGVVESFIQDCERRVQEQRDDRRRRDDADRRQQEEQRQREAQQRQDELRRQQEAQRQDEQRRREQTGSYHYVTGLDPNGDNWLALRSAPSFRAGWSKTRMGPGTLLTLLGRDGDWMNVRLVNGETGWAFSRYIACCRS